jgi:hypothetical protein
MAIIMKRALAQTPLHAFAEAENHHHRVQKSLHSIESRFSHFSPLCRYALPLHVILYGCETWSPTLREEHRLKVFENKVLRRIFALKRDEVTGGWRKLHNEELRDLYSWPSIITIFKSRRTRWAGHVARRGEERNAYRLLVGKPEGKRPLGRPRRRWVVNIKMDLLEIGWGGVDWIGLAEDRDKWRALVSAVMNFLVP